MIREAKIEDFNSIFDLITILEEKEFDKETMFKIFNKHLENSDYYYYVYENNQKIVGMISLLLKEPLHHNHLTGEILELCILPEYRSLGIGEKLLKHIENHAKDLKLIELELSSHMKRKDAHRFYERHLYIKDHYNFTKKI